MNDIICSGITFSGQIVSGYHEIIDGIDFIVVKTNTWFGDCYYQVQKESVINVGIKQQGETHE